MNLIERSKNILVATGSQWILWLLIALSVASIAVIIERIFALRTLRGDMDAIRRKLVSGLREGGFAKAREALTGYRHPAVLVVLRVLAGSEHEFTVKQAEEAMSAEVIGQRRSLEKKFNFLATLGANAPFIGLFGTVIGILQAFEALGQASAVQTASAVAPQAVMGNIAEALVATAVGLGVAIPAIFAYNMFQRTVKSAMDDGQMLSLEVLSYLSSDLGAGRPASERSSVEIRASKPKAEARTLAAECSV